MLWARQAMAGELSAAIAVATHLDAQVDERAAELTGAAIRRRTVEKLSERHAEAERDAQQTASQLAADDLTTSRNRRGNTKR
jgi:flagellar biosynthesis chaperone FliJ